MSEQYVTADKFDNLKERVIVLETNHKSTKEEVGDIKKDIKDIKNGQTRILYWIMGTMVSVLCCFFAIIFTLYK